MTVVQYVNLLRYALGKMISAWLPMKTKQTTTVTLYVIAIAFKVSYVPCI